LYTFHTKLEDDDYTDRGDLDKAIVLGIQAFSSITGIGSSFEFFFPAGCTLPRLVLRLLICASACTYPVHNIYVTYSVAMRPYFSQLWQFRQLLCVATVGSLAQLWVWGGYWEAEST